MKKAELVGRKVEIVFFDDMVKTGILGYTPEFSEKYGWRKADRFTLGNWDFRVSHTKKSKGDRLRLDRWLRRH